VLRRALVLIGIVLTAGAAAWVGLTRWPLPLPQTPFVFSVHPGATLREVAHGLTGAGVLPADWILVALARVAGVDRSVKAGSYEIASGTTLSGLLAMFSQGDATQASLTIIEGWTVRDLRHALRADADVLPAAVDVADADLMGTLGATGSQPEGWFFPDTYFFPAGATDLSILARAHRAMEQRLAEAWAARAPGLPFETPYQALILASIVEKETGRTADRPLIASALINRLQRGMRLQADPTVIYGLGDRFDGNLTKRELDTDTAYNTYTRDGLPPTPIALPSQASLDAVLHPPATPYLYFVSRKDGSTEFSTNLIEHNRAVAKYQKGER